MKEVWKNIKGSEECYQVSSLGKIRSVDRIIATKDGDERKHAGRLLKPGKDRGYSHVMVKTGGRFVCKDVHRLVAEHFIPNVKNDRTVNHIDGNKDNNAVLNLEWCTYKQNFDHAVKIGLTNFPKKLNKKQVRVIKHIKNIPNHISQSKLAKIFNVSKGTIFDIWKEKTWRSVKI